MQLLPFRIPRNDRERLTPHQREYLVRVYSLHTAGDHDLGHRYLPQLCDDRTVNALVRKGYLGRGATREVWIIA